MPLLLADLIHRACKHLRITLDATPGLTLELGLDDRFALDFRNEIPGVIGAFDHGLALAVRPVAVYIDRITELSSHQGLNQMLKSVRTKACPFDVHSIISCAAMYLSATGAFCFCGSVVASVQRCQKLLAGAVVFPPAQIGADEIVVEHLEKLFCILLRAEYYMVVLTELK